MNYELAKELKDAGFPQKERSIIVGNEDSFVADPTRLNEWLYAPTLSELIEACGERFAGIEKDPVVRGAEEWSAAAWVELEGDDGRQVSEFGPTPEEAVARLWLALNKK